MSDESVQRGGDHHETIADIIDDSNNKYSFLQETQRALNNLRPKPPLQQEAASKKYASDDEEDEEESGASEEVVRPSASVKTNPRTCTKLKRSYQLEYSSDESDDYDSLVQKNISLSAKHTSLNLIKQRNSNTSKTAKSAVNSPSASDDSQDEKKSRRAVKKPAVAENLSDSSDNSNSDSSDDDDDDEEDDDEDDEYLDDDDEDEEEEEDDDDDDSDYSGADSDTSFPFKKVKKKKKSKKSSQSSKHLRTSASSRKKKSSTSAAADTSRSKSAGARKTSSSSKNSSGTPHSKRTTTSKTINYCEESDEDESYSEEKPSRKEKHNNTTTTPVEPLPSTSSSASQVAAADEGNIETIEKVLKHRLGRVGATGSKTAIYNVEETGDPNTAPADGTAIYEDQYLIKWQNWAHIHNTWESRESLLNQKAKGFKKLENFLKKQDELRAWKADASSPEDVEFYECQMEMLDNLLESHTIVERIVSSNKVRNAATGLHVTDYLCKWQGLPYSDCTWEDGELIAKRFGQLVADYERRQTVQTLPPANVRAQKVLKVRPRFVALKEKPAYLGTSQADLKLRDYQLDGLNWLAHSWCKQNSVILADEMGLGKTIQTISFISYVFNEHSLYGPFLIVIPLSTMQGWQREFDKWAPEINCIVYLGDISSRNMIQKYELTHPTSKRFKCNAILTTYEILLKDKSFFNSISWAVLLVDEAHRLKNEDSLLYRTLINFDTNHRLLITGTPLQNSLKELWALVHFIMPERFDCWEQFDRKYASVLTDGQRFSELHRELQPYLLRRVKKDVEKSLPSKVEQILRVEMTNVQKNYYKLILTKNYKELSKGAKGSVSSFLNIMMELKKCSNHVYLIRRDDDTHDSNHLEKLLKGSGKLLLLDKLLRRLKETGHRVLIFSQMVRMLDIIAEYLRYRRFPFQRLDGSIKGEIRRQALDHFNKPDSEDFCFLLSTRAGGLGINLATADTVIIYDSDWNPQNDLQAQARAHRIGQKNQVNIYRLVSKNSIEEDIVERAKQKIVLDHLVIQRMDTTGRTVLSNNAATAANPFSKEEINSILKFGAEELFKEKETEAAAAVKAETAENEEELQHIYDIDEILKRAETRADEETSHMSASDELLSQFKVANFSTMEDDPILPSSMNTTPKLGRSVVKDLQEPQVSATGSGLDEKSWDDIIPLHERQRIELEIEEEQLRQINLASTGRRNRVTKDQYLEDEDEVDKSAAVKKSSSSSSSSKKASHKKTDKRHAKEHAAAEPVVEYDDASQLEVLFEEEEAGQADASKRYQTVKKSMEENVHFLIRGLNTQEVRRFVRSFKKFPCPLLRIDTVAQDAQLEDKSQAFLIDFATKMKELFTMACKAYDERYLESNGEGKLNKKRAARGPNIVLNGIKLNARQILDAEKYFQPLADFFASNIDKKFKSKLKQPYWDCEWTQEDDWALLEGIYEYGYGNWELIKADAHFNLGDKILRTETKTLKKGAKSAKSDMMPGMKTNMVKLKPQSKHLKTRVAYLMKVLASQINAEKYGPEWKTIMKKELDNNTNENSNDTAPKPTASESISRKFKRKMLPWSAEYESSSDTNQKESAASSSSKSKRARKTTNHHHHDDSNDSDQSDTKGPPSRKHHLSSSANHHHHHGNHNSNNSALRNDENNNDHDDHSTSQRSRSSTHHAATAVESKSKEKKIILSEKVFNECKNLMRPVKRALKNIDIKEINMTERDEIDKMKKHLLEIGDQINDELSKYSDPDKAREWRNYLWVFVSKFSTWNPERLRNLYKKFASKRNEEELESNSNTRPSSSPYETTTRSKPQVSSYDNKSYYSRGGQQDDRYSNSNMSPPRSTKKSSFKTSNRELEGGGGGGGYDSPSLGGNHRPADEYFENDTTFKYDYYANQNPNSKQQQPPFSKNPHHHHHYQPQSQSSYNLNTNNYQQQQQQYQTYHHGYSNSNNSFHYDDQPPRRSYADDLYKHGANSSSSSYLDSGTTGAKSKEDKLKAAAKPRN